MSQKKFNLTAGYIFLIVAVVHALRLFYGWGVVLGGFTVPMWASWAGVALAGFLSWSAFKFSKHQ